MCPRPNVCGFATMYAFRVETMFPLANPFMKKAASTPGNVLEEAAVRRKQT